MRLKEQNFTRHLYEGSRVREGVVLRQGSNPTVSRLGVQVEARDRCLVPLGEDERNHIPTVH